MHAIDSPHVLARSEQILVVDDDLAVRTVLHRTLERRGFSVTEADSASAALAHFDSGATVSLMMSDLHMPGMSGLELLREVHSRYSETAVIMLTGDADITTAVECLRNGADDYINKPVITEEVGVRVERVLETRTLASEVTRLRENYRTELELRVAELSRKNQAMFLGQVRMAVLMLEAKDPYTSGHSVRVAALSASIATTLGLPPRQVEDISLGGELHDIGKIGLRDAVLHKAGPLTDEEFAEVRRHMVLGAEMLSVVQEERPDIVGVVRSHHERMDGKGFPDGLAGEAIPMSARIVAVADAFDAMTSSRAYRAGVGRDVALAEIELCCNGQFDPDVVRALRTTLAGSAVGAHDSPSD